VQGSYLPVSSDLTSSSVSSKSYKSAFSTILECVTDFGNGTYPYSLSAIHLLTCTSPAIDVQTHLLQTPSNQHLRGRLPIFLDHRLQDWLLESSRPYKRTIGLNNHPSLFAPLHDIPALQPGVDFPLPYANFSTLPLAVPRFQFGYISIQFVKVMYSIVRDADGADFPFLLSLDQSAPTTVPGLFTAVRGVDEVSKLC